MEERETFEERVGPALDALFDGALLLVEDRPRAEDLVVAAVLDASRRYRAVNPPRDFRKWIVGGLVRWYLERDDRAAEDAVVAPGGGGAPVGTDPPEEGAPGAVGALGTLAADLAVLEREDPARLGRLVRGSLRKLPARRRLAVWLVDVMEFSYAEASRAMGSGADDFRETLYRARRDLQPLLGPAVRADVERGEGAPPREGEA